MDTTATKQSNQRLKDAILEAMKRAVNTDDMIPVDIIELINDFSQLRFAISPEWSAEDTGSNLKCSTDPEYDCNYIIEMNEAESHLQFMFEPAISEFEYEISFGIQPLTEETKISLVIDHSCNRKWPSSDNARYDFDGYIWNYSEKYKPGKNCWTPEMKEDKLCFGINDIIYVKINIDDKTIEFFQNGSSVYQNTIAFECPWYFGIWPNSKQGKFKIILNEDQLM